MIRNALTGEPKPVPKSVVREESDFTAEGAPPPGHISGTDVPATVEPASPLPLPPERQGPPRPV
jgi:hypothetical protein